MRWLANRPRATFREEASAPEQKCPPLDSVKSELRESLLKLAETINQTVQLLDRFESRFAEVSEPGAEGPRWGSRLIPTRRSELLAKIDMKRRFRRED
jgi:hypothetical protein